MDRWIFLGLTLLASCGDSVNQAVAAAAGHAYSEPRYIHSGGRLDLPDYRDCNDNALDGRETDVLSSDTHCGDCNRRCDAGVHCNHGACGSFDAGPEEVSDAP